MRQLKFRAWNLHTKTMLMPSDVSTMPMMPEIRHADGDTGTIYLQWTGLLDKNGKEIYEGDVCKGHDGGNWEIYWREEPAGWGVRSEANEFNLRCTKIDLDVLGNIYENPELL